MGKVDIKILWSMRRNVCCFFSYWELCNYENRNNFGFNGKPSVPSVIYEDVFKMGEPIVIARLRYFIMY